MMHALVARELIVAARRSAVPLTACGIAAVLTAFVFVWSPGVSVLAPMNLYEQTRLLHWILLGAALPWTAVRSAPGERADAFVLMAAFTGLRPATVVVGKTVAMTGVLTLVVLTGLPALVLAQQAAAVPFVTVLRDLLPLLGVALLVAVAATASILMVAGSLTAWLAAAGIASIVLLPAARWAPDASTAGLLSALAATIGAGYVRSWSDGALRFLQDGNAD
jgi:hypothetical protein